MATRRDATTEAADLRRLLDTLTLPYDVDDCDARILRRASIAHEALAEQPGNLGWNVDYLTQKLAEEQADADRRGGEGQ